jgi:hypothetical protein
MNFRKGDSGVFLHGKYWYDFELPKDGIQSLHDIDDHGRAQRQGLRPPCWADPLCSCPDCFTTALAALPANVLLPHQLLPHQQ